MTSKSRRRYCNITLKAVCGDNDTPGDDDDDGLRVVRVETNFLIEVSGSSHGDDDTPPSAIYFFKPHNTDSWFGFPDVGLQLL